MAGALDTLRSQQVGRDFFEIIFVDNASSDGTQKHVCSLARRDFTVKCVSEPNSRPLERPQRRYPNHRGSVRKASKATCIEPGPFRTDWTGRSLVQTPTQTADYADTAGVRLKARSPAAAINPAIRVGGEIVPSDAALSTEVTRVWA